MTESKPYEVLTTPGPVRWVKDRGQILILRERDQGIHELRGVEAVVWTWLTLAYSYAKIVEMLAILLGLSSDETGKRLRIILQNWRDTGILDIEAG